MFVGVDPSNLFDISIFLYDRYLGGGFSPPLAKNMSSSVEVITFPMEKIKHVPNHQPDFFVVLLRLQFGGLVLTLLD